MSTQFAHLSLLVALLPWMCMLSGCVGGPTKDFYMPLATATAPHKGSAAVLSTERVGQLVPHYLNQGYVMLGTSYYAGKYPEPVEMSRQAKKVGASVVVFSANHLETIQGVSTFSVPNQPQTVTSTTHGQIAGYGGSANYSSQTTTVVPGGYTNYRIPYRVERYDVQIVFLGK